MGHRRIKKLSSLALVLLMFGGNINSTFANTKTTDLNNVNSSEMKLDLENREMTNLAYQLRDEFNKRPNESSEVVIKDVYDRNQSLINNMIDKSSISEDELLEFVSTNPNSEAVKKTFKDRSPNAVKAFFKDVDRLGEFVKTYKDELKTYSNSDDLPDYSFTLDNGRVLSIQGTIIGIDDQAQNEDVVASRAYTSTRTNSRSYYSWTNLKLLTVHAKGYFSYNNSSLPTAYPDASGTYVQKGFLSLWQINEWSEGGQQDPKAGNTKVYGAGSFYLGFDIGGGSMHFQTIKGEAGLKCDKTGYVWTYSYYLFVSFYY